MGYIAMILAGTAGVIAGAEMVLRGGSRLAAGIGVPPIIIGLTVVSIGTSAPELAIGVDSALQGAGDLAVGNVAGTNVVNLLFILGLSSALVPLLVKTQTVRFDLPAMTIAALMFLVMSFDGVLTRVEGTIMLLSAIAYTALLAWNARRESSEVVAEYTTEYGGNATVHGRRAVVRNSTWLVLGVVIVVVTADVLVHGATELARSAGVSDALIGLTIVAIGTSAPELATTITSTIRGERDIAVGNLIGSSVYNILLILGVTALVPSGGVHLGHYLVRVDIPIMTLVALLCVPVFVSGRRISRLEGSTFVAAYLVYLAYLIAERA